MPIDLYHLPLSAPCRAVRLVAAAVGVDLNLIYLNLFAGEHLKPEFLKMNPQHAIPTLDDNGFYLSESRAICTYLIQKYGKDDSLYPKDPQQRAIINQRLYFDFASLYQAYFDYYLLPAYRHTTPKPKDLEKVDKSFEYLEKILEGKEYVAGDHLTVADIVLATSVSNYTIFDFDVDQYKNTAKWFGRVILKLPRYQEINEEGLKAYRILIADMKNGIKPQ